MVDLHAASFACCSKDLEEEVPLIDTEIPQLIKLS